MITPSNAGNSPMYDPLAVQFMTQGQMGYMPDAQYLTPHDYGAFRTMPGMNMMGAMPQQQMTMFQAFQIQNRGRLPFAGQHGTPYIFDVYNPAAEQSWYQTMALRRWQDAQSSMKAGGVDLASRIGVGALLGGIPGMAVGAVMPDFTAPYTDRLRGMRSIQGQSIPRIMTGPDVAQGLGYGFSAPAARRLDASMRMQGAQDYIYKQEDYRELYQLGMEQGLFDFDITSAQHEQTIKTLRDNVEVMGKLLGSTDFKKLTQAMKRLLDMGMDPTYMASGTRLQAMSGFTAGMSIDAMSSAYGQPGAMAFSQAGLTPYMGSFAAMSSAAGIEISKRLGILSPDELARMGGVSGMVQRDVGNRANFMGQDGGLNDIYLAYALDPDGSINQKRLQKLTSGDFSMDEVFSGAEATARNDYADFELNKHSYRNKFMEDAGAIGMEMFQYNSAAKIGAAHMPGADLQQQLTLGYRQMGWEKDEAEILSRTQSDPEYFKARREEIEKTIRGMKESAAAETDYLDSPFRTLAVQTRTFFEEMGEGFFGPMLDRRARKTQREEDAQRGYFGMGNVDARKALDVSDSGIVGASISRADLQDFVGNSIDPRGMLTKKERRQVDRNQQGAYDHMWRMDFLIDAQNALDSETKDTNAQDFLEYAAGRTGSNVETIRAQFERSGLDNFKDIKHENSIGRFLKHNLGMEDRDIDRVFADPAKKAQLYAALGLNEEFKASIDRESRARFSKGFDAQKSIEEMEDEIDYQVDVSGFSGEDKALVKKGLKESPYAASVGFLEAMRGEGTMKAVERGSDKEKKYLEKSMKELELLGIRDPEVAERIALGLMHGTIDEKDSDLYKKAIAGKSSEEYNNLFFSHGQDVGESNNKFWNPFKTDLTVMGTNLSNASDSTGNMALKSQALSLEGYLKDRSIDIDRLDDKSYRSKIAKKYKDDERMQQVLTQARRMGQMGDSIDVGGLMIGLAEGGKFNYFEDTSIQTNSIMDAKEQERPAQETLEKALSSIDNILSNQVNVNSAIGRHITENTEVHRQLTSYMDLAIKKLEADGL